MLAQIAEIGKDVTAVLGALGLLAGALQHLPLPAKWSEVLGRFATYTAQKFSVNQRQP